MTSRSASTHLSLQAGNINQITVLQIQNHQTLIEEYGV
jgi:hypothetical protein